MDAAKRALSDEKYGQMVDLMDALPQDAKEFRFHIFAARWNSGAKESFRPLEKVLFSKFQAENFKDKATLAAYLGDKYGDGKYLIEAMDAHDARLIKIPAWTVTAGEEDMDDDDMDEVPRRGRGGWSRRRRRDDYDDDEDDDPRESRANVADLLSASARQNTAQVAQATRSTSDMMTMLMMTQSQQAEARAAEERRRDEMRAEERRREETRAEERRQEQEKDRREREERENRRRDEERRERDAIDARRREEMITAMQTANKRTEVMLGTVTAALPVLVKLFEKKEDNTLPILLKMSEKKDDPITLMLLKSMVDKSNDDSGSKNLIMQMGEMSKITAQMTAEQMKSVMSLSNDINGTIMKKAMEMMLASPQGQTTEGKGMIEQVMSALSGAAEIVKTLVPPAAPQQQQAQQPRAHRAAPTIDTTATSEPPTPGTQPVAAIEGMTTAEQRWAALTPEQQAAAAAAAPKGTAAVLASLMAIQTKQYSNQQEYQDLIKYLVNEMPLDLRVAVLNGDEANVLAITSTVVQTNADLSTWIFQPGVLDWIRAFTAQLPPSLEAVYGPAQQQRDQLAAAAQNPAASTEAGIPATTDATPAPTGEAAPIAQETTDQPAQQVELPDNGPTGELPEGGPTSHLSDPDAP